MVYLSQSCRVRAGISGAVISHSSYNNSWSNKWWCNSSRRCRVRGGVSGVVISHGCRVSGGVIGYSCSVRGGLSSNIIIRDKGVVSDAVIIHV